MLNGCAYCIDMHWKDLLAIGESPQRLYLLGAWEEATVSGERERAALVWADAVTNVQRGHVPDAVYGAVSPHFTEVELADLTASITSANAWNRLSIAARPPVGSYRSKATPDTPRPSLRHPLDGHRDACGTWYLADKRAIARPPRRAHDLHATL